MVYYCYTHIPKKLGFKMHFFWKSPLFPSPFSKVMLNTGGYPQQLVFEGTDGEEHEEFTRMGSAMLGNIHSVSLFAGQ